ncbi:MAG: hypothetical protein LBV38_00010 [Alistipes sp.]|jgi:hypothetical protein|nr:hypothetical protein [Alistipes sp.]
MLTFVGCSPDPVIEPAVKEIVIPEDLEGLGNGPQTRGLKEVWYESETGGVLTGPDLEPGDILYIDKSYSFEYVPTGVTIPYHPDVAFIGVAIGVKVANSYLDDLKAYIPEYENSLRGPISMEHTFSEPGIYEVKGNLTYYWSSFKDGIMPEFYQYWGQFYQSKTYTVVDPMSLLVISGPAAPAINTNVTYNTPTTTLPAGITFNGWTVSPTTYTSTNGLNNPSLTIKFTAYGSYTLTANFRLPNGTMYPVSMTVNLIAPKPAKPTLSASGGQLLGVTEQQWIGAQAGDVAYWVLPGANVAVGISGGMVSGATYSWDSGSLNATVGPNATYFNAPSLPYGRTSETYPVKCRAYKNGQYSDWSTVWLYVSNSLPVRPYQMSPDEEVDDVKTPEETETTEESGLLAAAAR